MKNQASLLLLTLISFSAYQCLAQQNINQQKNATMSNTDIASNQATLTLQEREYAVKLLNETSAGVFEAVKNLSVSQLAFKPSAGKWSVEECVKHIAAAEYNLWAMVEESLKKPANPAQRAGIKFTDQELVKAVEDRSHKSETFTALQPANTPYKTMADALDSFKENRERLIGFVKSTQLDLRNHVSVLPIGTYDAYQFILLISAHSNRHTQQIEEVKADASFPKK